MCERKAADMQGCAAKVDITVNNILAIVNTKLLADYVKLDERLLQLCCVVKHWAKRRQASPACLKSSLHEVMRTCTCRPALIGLAVLL